MLEFIVECKLVNSNKDLVGFKEDFPGEYVSPAIETFKVSIPEPRHDNEGVITSIAEAQDHMAGLALQCGKIVCWKGARIYKLRHEDQERKRMEKERQERGVQTDEEREAAGIVQTSAGFQAPSEDPNPEMPDISPDAPGMGADEPILTVMETTRTPEQEPLSE